MEILENPKEEVKPIINTSFFTQATRSELFRILDKITQEGVKYIQFMKFCLYCFIKTVGNRVLFIDPILAPKLRVILSKKPLDQFEEELLDKDVINLNNLIYLLIFRKCMINIKHQVVLFF